MLVCSPINQDCVRLTEEQYVAITKLARKQEFGGVNGKQLCFPVWEQLLENEDDDGDGFAWPVYSGWLGGLKLGLIVEGVNGGEELYSRILPIYEKSTEEVTKRLKIMGVPSIMLYLWFRHVGDGWFRLEVKQEKMIPVGQWRVTTESENKRRFQKMASDAFHIRRTRKYRFVFPKFRHAFFEPVRYLPDNSEGSEQSIVALLPSDSVELLSNMSFLIKFRCSR